MKKITYLFALFFVTSIIFPSCGARRTAGQDPATYDVGVVIDGVRWATRNVDTPGSFTKNPEDAGGLFTWYEAQNACPCGWRLPTREELQSLANANDEWIIKDGVNGRIFGTAPNQLFLPAAGWRHWLTGALRFVGAVGNYWSSTPSGSFAWDLGFHSGFSYVHSRNRATGFSVRCVAE